MPQRPRKIIFNLKTYTPFDKYKTFSVMHKQSNYHHIPFLTKLLKTDSKPKMKFVAMFPYHLYWINFCLHHLDKIYSQKGETEKRRAKEKEGKA